MRAGPVIHIGYHRTGSTFLQTQVFPNLSATSVLQPDLDELVHSDTFDAGAWRARFAEVHKLDDERTTIISHELISGTPEGGPPSRRARTALRLREAFPDARIIVVVRRQQDYVLSVYGYRVLIRGLDRRSLAAYLAEHRDTLEPSLQYDLLVERYVELFGRDRVLVLAFEQLGKDMPGFVQRIVAYSGCPSDHSFSRDRVNESTKSAAIIAINRALNSPLDVTLGALRRGGMISHDNYLTLARPYFAFKERALNPLLRRAVGMRGAKVALPAAWLERMRPVLAASNRRLATMASLDLASYGYFM